MRRDGDHDDGQKRALVLDLVNDIDTMSQCHDIVHDIVLTVCKLTCTQFTALVAAEL